MSASARLVNRLWLGAARPSHARFRAALRQPRRAQEAILARCLEANARSEFGRRHRFDTIRTIGEFQARVPLSSYDDYADAIERIRAGAPGVLTAERVELLEPSSGSTRAAKLIPYTRELQGELRRAVAPWLADLARTEPAILDGVSYWSITPAAPALESRDAAVRVGFDTDSAHLGGWLASLTRRALLDCDDLRHISDIAEFRRLTLLRLIGARDLRLISVWHPTFLTLLLDAMIAAWPALLRDLATGVPAADAVRGVRADPARARELDAADPDDVQTIWPDLAIVSCWGDGHAAAACAALAARVPRVHVQPKGLLATEACVSLPFAGSRPLAIRSHFFEFIDARGNVETAAELEDGATYSVVVTTGGGLYRYRLDDRIVVEGRLEQTPCIRFIGKQDCISDLRGEKLNEAFVAEILGRLLPTLAPGAAFAMLAPELESTTPRYALFIESVGRLDATLQARLETELARNPHYAHCVRLGQLAPVAIERVPAGAAERYLERLRGAGRRLGDIKPTALSPLAGWRETWRSAGFRSFMGT